MLQLPADCRGHATDPARDLPHGQPCPAKGAIRCPTDECSIYRGPKAACAYSGTAAPPRGLIKQRISLAGQSTGPSRRIINMLAMHVNLINRTESLFDPFG